MMTFDKLSLTKDTCQCLKDTVQDTVNVYARKINKPNPTEKDFSTKWEKIRDTNTFSEANCEELCLNIKSISINRWLAESQDMIIAKYVDMFLRNGNRLGKDSIYLFSFSQDIGVLKYTPTKRDKTHHDFYKSDNFFITSLKEIRIIEIKETDLYKKIILSKLNDEDKYL